MILGRDFARQMQAMFAKDLEASKAIDLEQWERRSPLFKLKEWGSRLWELARSKETAETLRRAEDAANDALSWMLADGLARSISVMAYSPAREGLGLVIKIGNVKQTLEIHHAV